ncbi:uncharacterized protein LOC123310688 [Coccinella septempunctata]|uniref:uncharacterized protein LOC123310688 n=1 Tax=Coccinella septempunctata TaxID=41139 RepID=UPI001D08DD82|nr:uncharacterized protein LOC123310688 [Coccinella septempunctata]
MFFLKSEPSVSRFKLRLKRDDILADIKNISQDRNQKEQLYSCLEEKPEYDQKINKIENFLKCSLALEEATENLQSKVDIVKRLEQKVQCDMNKLREKCSVYSLEQH